MINTTCLEEKFTNDKRQAIFEEDFPWQQGLFGIE